MKTKVIRKKLLVGIFYGSAAGLAYSIFTWGIDGYLLAVSHSAFPWIKFVLGVIACILCGSFVGWLTVRIQNTLVSISAWILMGIIFCKLTAWIFLISNALSTNSINRSLKLNIAPMNHAVFAQSQWLLFIAMVVICIIFCLLENFLIDQALFSRGSIAIIVPLILCFIAFGFVGKNADEITNKDFRDSIQIVDKVIQFSLDNPSLGNSQNSSEYLNTYAIKPIVSIISENRKLFLGSYKDSLEQLNVHIQFNNGWAACSTIYRQISECHIE